MLQKEYKQAIVVRNDLKMQKGKIAAQVAHASLTSAEQTKKDKPELFRKWWESGQKKVVLKVNSLDKIFEITQIAERNDIIYSIIEDKGLTQIPSGTVTCVGIGPDEEGKMDKITGKLKLL
jgi:PTH2 family peptidyl-tRNA hydrolase